MRFKVGDILIIIIVLLSALLIFLTGKKEQGGFAVLEVGGEVIKTFSLNENIEYVYGDSYQNTITVKNGEIFISNSTCPDKTCVKTRPASSSNEVICCLPNKLLIRVSSVEPEVDVISG